jgi:hypothetical protein
VLAVGSFITAPFRYSVSLSLHDLPLHYASIHFTHLSTPQQEWLIHYTPQSPRNIPLRNSGYLPLHKCNFARFAISAKFSPSKSSRMLLHSIPKPIVSFRSIATLAFSHRTFFSGMLYLPLRSVYPIGIVPSFNIPFQYLRFLLLSK